MILRNNIEPRQKRDKTMSFISVNGNWGWWPHWPCLALPWFGFVFAYLPTHSVGLNLDILNFLAI